MTRLLPTRTDASVQRTDDPSVLCIDDESARDVFEALASETAYDVFTLLTEEPATPATVADRLDMSVQNVHYHLEKLEAAELIEVTDTCYSEKGREMNVYVVSEDPMLVFLGTSNDRASLKHAFKSFSSFVGPTAILLTIGELASRLFDDG
ncbi:ArsR/SmtB family transcription factor [Halopiger djelfimassiliensis]|uniref:ArsR/SmtB family transcription factor n=1 Tax=Halopiger djelfimassiliensis TaxID=1293047 RepID=UPI000677D8EB|nr:helix-turn-helix domain-containing protein [Halopiger djelfimassiliensis]